MVFSRELVSLLLGETASKFLGFAGMVLIARAFGADALGIVAFGITILTILTVLGSFGLDLHGLRSIALHPESTPVIVSDVIATKFFLLLPVLAGGILFTAWSFRGEVHILTVLTLFVLASVPGVFNIDFLFTAQKRNAVIAARTCIQGVMYFSGVVLAVFWIETVMLIPVALSVSMIGGTLFAHSRSGLRVRLFRKGIVGRSIKTLRSSLFLGASQITVMLYLQLNLFILGMLLDFYQLGLYSAAQRIIAAISFVPSIVLQVFMARITTSTCETSRIQVIGELLSILGIAGTLLCGNMLLFAKEIVEVLYGPEYRGSVISLQILLAAVWLVFLNMSFANPLLLWMKEKRYFAIVAGAAIVNVISCILFSLHYGIMGAAIASLLTEFVVLALGVHAVMEMTKTVSRVRLLFNVLPAVFGICGVLVSSLTMGGNTVFAAAFFNISVGVGIAITLHARMRPSKD